MASRAFRKFVPLFDRVLIQRVEAQTKTASGIIIPESAQSKMNQGVVVAHGPGLTIDGEQRPLAVAVGDKVLLPEFGGTKLKLGDDEFLLYRDSEMIGKF